MRVAAATVVRIGLAIVLAIAAIGRLGDPGRDLAAVRAYDFLPDPIERGVAYGLPYLLLTLAVLLLLGLATRLAAIVTAVLFAGLLIGTVQAAARGLSVACGCFGTGGGQLPAGEPTGYPWRIALAAVLLLLAAALAVRPAARWALDDRLRRSAEASVADVRVGRRRNADARERLASQREAAGRHRMAWIQAYGVLALVVLTGAGIGIQAARVQGPPAPQAISLNDGVQLGRSGARVTIEIYEDASCQPCAGFANQSLEQLQSWMDTNTAKVRFFEVSFQDALSTTKYSTRGARAMYCAADAGRFLDFRNYLFENQPPPGNEGLSDDQMIHDASVLGIAGPQLTAFTDCVKKGKYANLVSQMTDAANTGGILATPTVLVNGDPVSKVDLPSLQAAVNDAR